MEEIIIGRKPKVMKVGSRFVVKPKRKYRILVQERISEKCDTEKMRSFMVYDFDGRSTVDSVKKKIMKKMSE